MKKKLSFLSLAVFVIAIIMITPAKLWSFHINSPRYQVDELNQESNEEFCRDVYQYFGNGSCVWADSAKDCGDFYEMCATIDERQVEDGSPVSYVDTVIRVRKNAAVYWTYNRDKKMTLDEYANYGHEKEITRKFSYAKMVEVTQDTDGYIIAFVVSNAG